MNQKRLLTGIPELDVVLRGGLLAGRIHLIEGVPGTGKTTFGLRFLIDGAERGEPSLYITLSETSPYRLGLSACLENMSAMSTTVSTTSVRMWVVWRPSMSQVIEP